MEALIGKCTWRFALTKDETTGCFTFKKDIVDATRAEHGVCPLCGHDMVARKGNFRNDHWAHLRGRNCDNWYEPKGEWHRAWQGRFDQSWQEVPVVGFQRDEKHIADIRTPNGIVVECQYSHLSKEEIKIREAFYGKMLWIVSGTRLVYDRPRFEPLMTREFAEKDGVYPYLAIHGKVGKEHIGRFINRFWSESRKLVFFDFEGTFNEPCYTNDLYCLLPDEYTGGHRIIAKVPQQDLVEAIKKDDESLIFESVLKCGDEFEADCRRKRQEDEERERKSAELLEREKQLKRQADLENPVKMGITCGWVEAWLYTHDFMDSAYGFREKELPANEKIAIHLKHDYSAEDYDRDRMRALEMQPDIKRQFPQYPHLQRYRSAIVARADVHFGYDENGEGVLYFDRVERLPDMNGNPRIVRDIPDGDRIWALTEEQIVAVNDRAYRDGRKKALPKRTISEKEKKMVYTGKGKLYRDSERGWLHLLRDGIFVPLKKEHQDWDKTYDKRFASRDNRKH